MRILRRRHFRLFDDGPSSTGFRFIDALYGDSGSVDQLSINDALVEYLVLELVVLELAHIHSAVVPSPVSCTSRPPLLQNR